MAKSNSDKCKEYRQRRGKVLVVPMPASTDKCLAELMEWHDYTDGRDAIATFIHRLHAMGSEGSKAALTVLRHDEPKPAQVEWR